MRLRALLSLCTLLAVALGATASGPEAAARAVACGSGAHGSHGYAYAGHQATSVAHGVRAEIVSLSSPQVGNGHVAGWVGVGGPGSGPDGEDQWLQAGIASLPGTAPMLYVELTRAGSEPAFRPIRFDLRPGERHLIAVLEVSGRPGWWRVRVDGKPVTAPIALPGSSNRWKPIVTAESWDGGSPVCNGFAFRFAQVAVAHRLGGGWQQFVPGERFLDRGLSLRQLRPTADGARILAHDSVLPFAFEAVSDLQASRQTLPR